MRVALKEGDAVRAADAKGPCWDLNIAPWRPSNQATPRQTRTSSPVVWWLSAASCVVGGWAPVLPLQGGRGMRQLGPRRQNLPLPPLLCTAGLETRDTSNFQMPGHRLGNDGVSLPQRVGPAGKMGGTSDSLCALESPNPPQDKANVAITCAPSGAEGIPKMLLKHLHTEASWRSAKLSVNSDSTVLNQKFALVEPHMRRSKKAA